MSSENKIRVGRLDMDVDLNQTVDGKSQYLKVADVAQRLSVSPMTVYRQIEQGKLPMIRVGNSIRVNVADLAAYVREQTLAYGAKEGK